MPEEAHRRRRWLKHRLENFALYLEESFLQGCPVPVLEGQSLLASKILKKPNIPRYRERKRVGASPMLTFKDEDGRNFPRGG